MIRQNLHMHSTFDDGRDSCKEMLEACRRAGMTSAGVSLHSPMPFRNTWSPDRVRPFVDEMNGLKGTMGDFSVFAGIELDVLAAPEIPLAAFDYVIGAVHHLPIHDIPPAVDGSPEQTEVLLAHFGGDAQEVAVRYYEQMIRLAEHPSVDIVAHFDLFTKFDEKHHFFDPDAPRVREAALRALRAVTRAGKIVEVNTGAISRGWRTSPYPARSLLCALREMGGRVTIGSDAHACAGVACAFPEAEALVRACGFSELWQLFPEQDGCVFLPVPLDRAGD